MTAHKFTIKYDGKSLHEGEVTEVKLAEKLTTTCLSGREEYRFHRARERLAKRN